MAGPAKKPGAPAPKPKASPAAAKSPVVNKATGFTTTKPAAAPKVSAATAKTAATTQARLAYRSAPGRSPVVNAATGFTTSTKGVTPTPVQSPRVSGYQPTKAPSGPLSGVGQFIQEHVDLATGRKPTNISDALHGGMDRPTNAFGVPRQPKK